MSRKPNSKNEFLLDVYPCVISGGNVVAIYNLTRYFDSHNGISRKRFLSRVVHQIKGNQYTILIIDAHHVLNAKMARKLASDWYLNNLVEYKFND